MPKRSTQSYSSEDAPDNQEKIHVYYCKYSGNHVLITDAVLEEMPRRRTDNAIVVDTDKYTVRLKVKPAGVKLIKRGAKEVEKQFRYNCGPLPVCYMSEENGRYLYIMDGALNSFGENTDDADIAKEAPVPPCIQAVTETSVQIAIEIEDKAPRTQLVRVSADDVGIQVVDGMNRPEEKNEEILECMAKVLRLRKPQMQIGKGWSNTSRLLVCQDISKRDVYQRMMKAVKDTKQSLAKVAAAEAKKEEAAANMSKMVVTGLNVS